MPRSPVTSTSVRFDLVDRALLVRRIFVGSDSCSQVATSPNALIDALAEAA
jgi:hypothetical protein